MSDDADDLLRRAMATLDHQAPSGYFDTLPERTLARLDDPAIGPALAVAPDEAASSDPRAPATRPVGTATPVATPVTGPGRGHRRGAVLAAAGLGLAAAAGVVVVVSTRGGVEHAAPAGARDRVVVNSMTSAAGAPPPAAAPAPATAVAAEHVASEPSALRTTPSSEQAAAGSAAAAHGTAEPDTSGKRAPPKRAAGKWPTKGGASSRTPDAQGELGGGDAAPVAGGVGRGKPAPAAGAAGETSGKPAPGRTSLSADEVQRGMTAVAGQAQACFAGTRGLATLRLIVAPSGRVAQVLVTGPFAGTPVAACIVRAVQAASFPPWDGRPQSFGYSYLLSD